MRPWMIPMFLLAACGPLEGEVLVIGDSMFRANSLKLGSIPTVLEEELGVGVANASVSGSQFLTGADKIPGQFEPGTWSWLVMDGGGNDLNKACGCTDCAAVLDQLVAADAPEGAMLDFIDEMQGRGLRVVLFTYYDVASDAQLGFGECGDEFAELRERLITATAGTEVVLVDGRDAFSVNEKRYYSPDGIHPSLIGSARIGELIADEMRKAGFKPAQ